jgi:hypothetical protein
MDDLQFSGASAARSIAISTFQIREHCVYLTSVLRAIVAHIEFGTMSSIMALSEPMSRQQMFGHGHYLR